MSFKLNNHPNKSNSGLKFSEQKQNETLQKQKEAIQRITDRKNQPGLFENWDNVQTTLEGVGMTPGPQGMVSDGINTVISLGRGMFNFLKGNTESGTDHMKMAGLHALSFPPAFGKIAESYKLGRNVNKVAKNINKTEPSTHFKSVKETTHPIRGGRTLTDPVGEYNNLVSMHRIAPENFVKPLGIHTDRAGDIIGFNMSKVKGKTLLEHLDGGGNFTKDMQKQLNTTITKINDQGYYHGDLNLKNIIVKPSGKLVIIDPVGAPNLANMSEELAKDLIKRDKTAVSDIINLFNK